MSVLILIFVKQIVHSRTATALCLTSVKNEDKHDFSKIVEAVKVWLSLVHVFCCVNCLSIPVHFVVPRAYHSVLGPPYVLQIFEEFYYIATQSFYNEINGSCEVGLLTRN